MERCAGCGAVAWAAVDLETKVPKGGLRIPLCRECIRVLDDGRDLDAKHGRRPGG